MIPGLLDLAVAVGAENAFAGHIVQVHDGDTVAISVLDILLSVPVVLAVRIGGVNAPELSEPGGKEVRDLLAEQLPVGSVVTLRRVKPDKYAGRIVAQVTTAGGLDVAFWLIDHGYAVAWSGVGVKPKVDWPPAESAGRW